MLSIKARLKRIDFIKLSIWATIWIMLLSPIVAFGIFTIHRFMLHGQAANQRDCVNNLYYLDQVKKKVADILELEDGTVVDWSDPDVKDVLYKVSSGKRCPSGGKYILGPIGEHPKCTYKAPWWGKKDRVHDIDVYESRGY